ncbi:AAA family ATPase [Vibrio sp. FNV 38]|nr:AAA family ATPase [Vibrio sp. FNV 38]
MYKDYFGFSEWPFSIVPNSRYLYMSQRHQEAIAYLKSGLVSGGGMAMLTGEVGTGKTTVAKSMLNNLEPKTKAGLILNPTFSSVELLQAVCDEYAINYHASASLKDLSQAIHHYLLDNHARGVQTLLVIDEAQHLAPDVLEQLRLITNLETESQKLLKVLLVGQPELQQKLQWPQLRQLAQRITGRYHLLPLDTNETEAYIRFRIATAGGSTELFNRKMVGIVAGYTQGIPRLINLVCDESLKQAHHAGMQALTPALVDKACQSVMAYQMPVQFQPAINKKANVGWKYAAALLLGCSATYAALSQVEYETNQQLTQIFPLPEQILVVDVIEQETLSNEVTAVFLQGLTAEGALRDLYRSWGFKASMFDTLCLDDNDSSISCTREQGSIESLIELNMPAVITLNMEGQLRYAVLSNLSSQSFSVVVGNQELSLPLEWLGRLWTGEYRYLWESHFEQTLREGMQGPSVTALNDKLTIVFGDAVASQSVFDVQLKRRVEAFQRWQGMEVDGIAGKQTLTRLDLMTQAQAPRLVSEREVW